MLQAILKKRDEFLEPITPKLRCVTPFGLGTVLEFDEPKDRYLCQIDTGATAWLQRTIVQKTYSPEVGDKVSTPYAKGIITSLRAADRGDPLYIVELANGSTAYIQKTLLFPDFEPDFGGFSLGMLEEHMPQDFKDKLANYTTEAAMHLKKGAALLGTGQGAGYVGATADLLREGQIGVARFYAVNRHLISKAEEAVQVAYDSTADLRGALEKAYADLAQETEDSEAIKKGKAKIDELKKELSEHEEFSSLVNQLDSAEKWMELAKSEESEQIQTKLSSLASTVSKSSQFQKLLELATPQLKMAQSKMMTGATDMAADMEKSAPEQADAAMAKAKEKAAELSKLSGMSLEESFQQVMASDGTKGLVEKAEGVFGEISAITGVKKEDLDPEALLKKASDMVPEYAGKASALLAEHGEETYEKAAAFLDQHKGLTDTAVQQLRKYGGVEAGGDVTAKGLLATASSALQNVDETQIVGALEKLDVEEWQKWGEKVATDKDARNELANKVKNSALDYLMQYLPSIQVPPIEGEKDQVEYFVDNLGLGGFKIKKESVEVTLGDFQETGEIINVKAADIHAIIPKLKWSYKQQYFPFMNGTGLADAIIADGCVNLGFRVERTVEDGVSKPRLALNSSSVEVTNLIFQVEGSWFSWVYNVLSAIFSQVIQEYIVSSLTEKMLENMGSLLGTVNGFAGDYWPMLLKHAGVELEKLPLASEAAAQDEEAAKLGPAKADEVDLVITDPGPLGLRLDSSSSVNATVVGFSKMANGDKGPVEKSGKIKMGAQLIALAGRNADELAQSEIVRLMRAKRPLTMRFKVVAPTETTQKNEYEVTFADGAIGLKVQPRPQGKAAVVSGFREGAGGQPMAAEQCGKIKVGDVMVSINGTSIRESTFEETMSLFKGAARPITLCFLYNSDFSVRFNEWPPALKLASLGATEESKGHVVVTGFEPLPGAAESGGQIGLGDVVEAIAGRSVLSPAAPRDLPYPQVIRMLKAAKMKLKGKTGMFFTVRFMSPPAPSGADASEAGEDRGPAQQGSSYDVSFDEGPLGIVFGVTEGGRTCVKKFAALKGPAESSGLVRPGLVLLRVNKEEVPLGDMEAAMKMISEAEAPCSLTFRDMERFLN
jgi:hypothetical protein